MKHLITYAALLMSYTATAQTDCPNAHDSNGDGAVTISDLLDLLSLFGDVDTDHDGIWDSVDECVDLGACNYAAEPTEACAYIDVLGICGGGCEGDGDGDGICDDVDDCVGTLDALGVCGGDCAADEDADGICDDVDDCVGEYDECDVCNGPGEIYECGCSDIPEGDCDCDGNQLDALGVCGGDCAADEDADGICDDVDDCIGEYDECGVCNGPGATEIVIDAITILYDSVYAEQIDTWFVFEVGTDTTFSYTCAPFFSDCGDPLSYQGYDYATVLIGDQCWFAENLRSENYENGDAIPAGLSDSEWQNTTSGAVAVYGEDAGCNNGSPDIDSCDPVQSLNEYGRLYNWYAVDDARGLCPSGWHVPTDGEWTVMTDHLGGASIAGGQMKTNYGWYNGGNGTNSSGFSGLPGGTRYDHGGFLYGGTGSFSWSSSPYGSEARFRFQHFSGDNIISDYSILQYGYSVRCVRDAE